MEKNSWICSKMVGRPGSYWWSLHNAPPSDPLVRRLGAFDAPRIVSGASSPGLSRFPVPENGHFMQNRSWEVYSKPDCEWFEYLGRCESKIRWKFSVDQLSRPQWMWYRQRSDDSRESDLQADPAIHVDRKGPQFLFPQLERANS